MPTKVTKNLITSVDVSQINTTGSDAGKVLTSNGSTLNWEVSSAIVPSTGIVAWVNFDGSKDTLGTPNTDNTNRLIRSSLNVTSVLKTATGEYTITFTSALTDANYVVAGMAQHPSTSSYCAPIIKQNTTPTATELRVLVIAGTSSGINSTPIVHLIVSR